MGIQCFNFNTYCSCYHALLVLVVLSAATRADDETCTLCSGGEQVSLPEKQVKIDWPVSVRNCSMLDEYANSLERDSKECADVQSIGTICGCPVPENACRLCPDRSNITQHHKTLGFLMDSFGGVTPTCELFDAYLYSVDANTSRCGEAQATSSACGCPIAPNACTVCHDGENVGTPNRRIPRFPLEFEAWDIDSPTCELIEAVVHRVLSNESDACLELQGDSYICGCSYPKIFWQRQAILAWLPRITAPLSFFGSMFIIYDVLKRPQNQRTTQHQLLLFMSCIDCMSSVAWALSTTPIPATDDDGNPTHIYGAKGNDATCKAQGFFIQLGLITPLYNVALAVYFLLVISYGWNESQLKKVRCWMYMVPLVIGLGLAFGGIPLYEPSANMCYVYNDESYRNILIFLVVPISIVIVLATLIMVKVYLKVYHQQQAARRWTRGRSNVDSLPRKVFWQSFWYLMCFYVSWPILVVIQFVDTDLFLNYWFLCLAMIIAPIQGFLNFITYTRRRFQRFMKENHFSSWASLRHHMTHSTQGEHESSEVDNRVEAAVAVSAMPPVTRKAEEQTPDTSNEQSPSHAENGNSHAPK